MSTATEVRERPILFSKPMVRAILDGRKTQTRRVVKPQPTNETCFAWFPDPGLEDRSAPGGLWTDEPKEFVKACPYGVPGDRLWVRETWGAPESFDKWSPARIEEACRDAGYETGPFCDLFYDADSSVRWWGDDRTIVGKWRPSIHMPRWASRITLEVTEVRVERVRDITPSDCVLEGVHPTMRNEAPVKDRFRELWDSINTKRGFGWESNPWVWVVTFRSVGEE